MPGAAMLRRRLEPRQPASERNEARTRALRERRTPSRRLRFAARRHVHPVAPTTKRGSPAWQRPASREAFQADQLVDNGPS